MSKKRTKNLKRLALVAAIAAVVSSLTGGVSNAAPAKESGQATVLLAKTADGSLATRQILRGKWAGIRFVRLFGMTADEIGPKGTPRDGSNLYAVCKTHSMTLGQFWGMELMEGAYVRRDKSADGFVGGPSFPRESDPTQIKVDANGRIAAGTPEMKWSPVLHVSRREFREGNRFIRKYAARRNCSTSWR